MGREDTIWALAFQEARTAAEAGEVPVGAVLTAPDGTIVASAGNRTLRDHDPTAHAEVLAIRYACKAAGSERLPGYDLYITLEPCPLCAAAISFARIRRLYYGASDPKSGAVENGVQYFADPTCHHAPDVYAGFHDREAAELLRAFFKSKR